MTYLPQVREALVAAVPAVRPRRRVRRPLVLAIALLVAVAAAAGALAATGVIPIGKPIHPIGGLINRNPHRGAGVIVPGSVRLLPIRVADPDGGPPWGMRVLGTTRGVGCVQVGRVVDGKLGVLGRDGLAHDDGRFHPLPTTAVDPWNCQPLDVGGRMFVFVTGRGFLASGPGDARSCLAPGEHAGPGDPIHTPCPARDQRAITYGLLGPEARSVTYLAGSRERTVPVAGPDGAYLIVTRSHARYGGVAPGVGAVVGVTARGRRDYPLVRVAYGNGHTCPHAFTGRRPAIVVCPPVGYRRPQGAAPTSDEVARPLDVRVRRVHAYGHVQLVINVSFRAPVAVAGVGSYYELDIRLPHTGACRGLMAAPRTSDRDLAAGDLVRLTATVPARCPGRVPAAVRLVTPATTRGASSLLAPWPARGPVVGRFTVRSP